MSIKSKQSTLVGRNLLCGSLLCYQLLQTINFSSIYLDIDSILYLNYRIAGNFRGAKCSWFSWLVQWRSDHEYFTHE